MATILPYSPAIPQLAGAFACAAEIPAVSDVGARVVEFVDDTPATFLPLGASPISVNAISMDNKPESQPMPNGSEPIRNLRQPSESLGNIPHSSESFRNLPNSSERADSHTLTVREVARMFEAAGVVRTERSIVNWCQTNPQGLARLDAFFDTNDRRWFITPQSVASAIAEEQAKTEVAIPQPSEVENDAVRSRPRAGAGVGNCMGLEQELLDLRILNRSKDFFIEQLQKDRDAMLERLVSGSHRIGELETRLKQIPSHRKSDESSIETVR